MSPARHHGAAAFRFAGTALAACIGLAATAPLPMSPVPQQVPADVSERLSSVPLEVLLLRAAQYSRLYEQTMSTAVLEERYVQLVKSIELGFPPEAVDTDRLAWLPGDGRPKNLDVRVYERRQTRADLLLVQLPNQRWWAFRDILEVNGKERRGHEERLRKLFLQGTDDSWRQLQRINRASADFNLGPFYRDLNVPTIGLMVFGNAYAPRFAFNATGIERVAGRDCRVVSFRETSKPTVIKTFGRRDTPLVGSACVDLEGTIWRTRIQLLWPHDSIDVVYGRHERVDVLVPLSMWEWYGPFQHGLERGPTYIEALATYSNLRQFTVETNESVK